MSDTPQHRPVASFPAAGDPCADASAEGVANFARARFRREFGKVCAEAVSAFDRVDDASPAPGGRLPRPRHLRLVR